MKRDWKAIIASATKAAEEKGHSLDHFKYNPRTPSVRTAMCTKCGGACWVAFASWGYHGGGRLMHFICGTHEAAGTKAREQ